MVNFFNRLIINQFDECWIPDVPTTPNLSGGLSHPIKPSLKKKAKYIGALSRMLTGEMKVERYDAIAVLSGPEPQRTKLEKNLIEQAGSISARFLIVQGRPEQLCGTPIIAPKENIEIVPSMTAEALNQAILESGVFIGRSGYSTVMDLARLGKPALLIPTPGQTEQECLAAKFFKENIFYCQEQSELHLEQGIIEAKKRSGLHGDFFDEKALSSAIVSFLKAC